MRKKYTTEQLDAIVADKLLFKLGTKEISEKHGFSRAFVDATVATYKNVAAGNWDKIQFMLDGQQMKLKTVEWAAAKCGVEVPASFYPKAEPPAEQTKLDEFGKPAEQGTTLKFGTGANNTLHALIDALKKNAEESAQLRKAIFALLNSTAAVD